MYADLVQQLQESFHFSDFAEQYSRPRSEVFDVFSAVVQLPLLKHSGSRKPRVSSAARRERMKTFRSHEKDAKAAHREERRLAKEMGTRRTRDRAAAKQRARGQKEGSKRARGLLESVIDGPVEGTNRGATSMRGPQPR
ncbi:MAG: hypothetical protein M1832_001400 [Thelocarpon impressellum]|nr:MAG: hypothetical protein M1832_001400 [Thelocarpon impressellum]